MDKDTTISELNKKLTAEEKRARKYVKYLFAYLISLIILIWPLKILLISSYMGAVIYNILCGTFLICAVLGIIHLMNINTKTNIFIKIVAYTGLVLSFLFIASLFSPLNVKNTLAKTKTYQDNQIYLSYSPNCKYCTKAKRSVNKAVKMYNTTHKRHVKLINLADEDNPLVQKAGNYIQYNGSIFKIKPNGDSTVVLYAASPLGKIKDPGPSEIYKKIIQVADN